MSHKIQQGVGDKDELKIGDVKKKELKNKNKIKTINKHKDNHHHG